MANFGPKDPHKKLADIFSRMKHGPQERLMKDLEERDLVAAERVKALMFTFDDLVLIDARGIQELLRHVDHQDLTLALKGASANILGLAFTNISNRVGKILMDDIEALGPVRAADVEEARARITATAKALADDGVITIADEEDDTYIT